MNHDHAPLADRLTQGSLSNPAVSGPLLWPTEADVLLRLAVTGVVEYCLVEQVADWNDDYSLPESIFRELCS